MKRREFITALGGAAAWPVTARAQQRALPVVGFLLSGTPEEDRDAAALLRGMSETGFVEGRNVAVEYRWSSNDPGRHREQAADLVSRHVSVIAANSAGAALRAKAATTTIPIVFVAAADAVQVGLVTNLARPGSREIDDAFGRAVQQRVEALAIARSQFFLDRRVQLTTLTVRHALPTIFFSGKFTEVGGLMSYARNPTDHFRQAGIYVGRILKGEKPADLPVMQPTAFEFVINLQTARTLGIAVPPTMLALADRIIE